MGSLMAAAKARPDHITCGTSGNGTLAHLAMEMMQQVGGFRTTHVPYRGGAPLVQAAIAGELDLCIASAAPIGRLVQDGTLVPLVQTGITRSALLPAVPTAQQAGLPGIDATAFWCILAPAALPPATLAAFHTALQEALAPAEIRTRMLANLGIEVVASGSEEFGRFLKDQMDIWAKVIRERNIRPD
jgi:tripartite-type tricarboxylate transporter receptor subunit TctC